MLESSHLLFGLPPSSPSPLAGLLQWVEDTQPLNLYLLGKGYTGGAHGRYMAPGEWNWMQCYNVSVQKGVTGWWEVGSVIYLETAVI